MDVTTNLMGEYDVQLLPGQYRIATSIDYQDPSIPTWSQNSFTGFSVDGWMGNQASTDIGNTGNTWVSAFPQHIKDNGSGGYNNDDVTSYSIWDMTEKQQWDQSAEYPSHPIVQDATYIPSDAYARVDLVFTPPVEISVNQLTVTTNSDGESVCANDNPAALTASLGPVFLGAESLTVKNDEGVEYISPMMHHLMAHKSGVDDPVVNDVDLVPHSLLACPSSILVRTTVRPSKPSEPFQRTFQPKTTPIRTRPSSRANSTVSAFKTRWLTRNSYRRFRCPMRTLERLMGSLAQPHHSIPTIESHGASYKSSSSKTDKRRRLGVPSRASWGAIPI